MEIFLHESRVASHQSNAKALHEPIVNPAHMPLEHRTHLACNADSFTVCAQKVGSMFEVIRFFLASGNAPD